MRRPIEAMRAEMRLAVEAQKAHATAVVECGAGFFLPSRRRSRWPHQPALAEGPAQWGASIPEDAPIWQPRREGTRVWRVGEEGGR